MPSAGGLSTFKGRKKVLPKSFVLVLDFPTAAAQQGKQACLVAQPLSGTFITNQRRRFRAGAARRGSRRISVAPRLRVRT